MRTRLKIALLLGALALAAAPAMALATKPAEPGGGHGKSGAEHGQSGAEHGQAGAGHGQSEGPAYHPAPPSPPGPGAGLPAKAKAYGRYCRGQSKKHVKGEKGTPFSRCVVAANQLRREQRRQQEQPQS